MKPRLSKRKNPLLSSKALRMVICETRRRRCDDTVTGLPKQAASSQISDGDGFQEGASQKPLMRNESENGFTVS
jgi:hypothetical protein